MICVVGLKHCPFRSRRQQRPPAANMVVAELMPPPPHPPLRISLIRRAMLSAYEYGSGLIHLEAIEDPVGASYGAVSHQVGCFYTTFSVRSAPIEYGLVSVVSKRDFLLGRRRDLESHKRENSTRDRQHMKFSLIGK